jgi:hypothetical protein
MFSWAENILLFYRYYLFLGLGLLGTTAALSGVMGVTLTMAIGGADMPGNIPILVRYRYSGTVLVTCCSLSKDPLQVGVNVGKLRDQCEGKSSEESYQQ